MKTKTYNDYMKAAIVSYVFTSFDNFDDALEFCKSCNWEYVDENGFSMVVRDRRNVKEEETNDEK